MFLKINKHMFIGLLASNTKIIVHLVSTQKIINNWLK